MAVLFLLSFFALLFCSFFALTAASPSIVVGLILGSFVLFGGSALAAYLYTYRLREQEARAVPDESLSEPPVDTDDK